MRGREPGFLNRPTVPARSRRNEQASTKKLRHTLTQISGLSLTFPPTCFTNLLFPLTRGRVQTQGCISWVNFPEEHQRSWRHRWTTCPFSSPSSSQLSHKGLEGETESRYSP